MEIRPLQIGDLFTIARMLEKTRANRVALTSNPVESWILLADSLLSGAPDDFLAWVAGLIGKEVKEFEAMPASTVVDIIKQLASQEDSGVFLFWILFTSRPAGREKLVKVCGILRSKFGLAPDEISFSLYAQALRNWVRSRGEEVADALAEAEEIIALAREKGK